MAKSIRATNFYEFVKCPRKVYLYFFGDQDKRLPYSDFLQEKFKQGNEFEKKVIAGLDFDEPKGDSYEEKAKSTLELMKKGTELIYQGVLIKDNLLGIPDLLEKKQGKSNLGDFYYQIGDIKSGLSAKQEYVMQVMFYSSILEKLQGFMPSKAYLILGNKSKVEIDIKENLEKFTNIFYTIDKIEKGKEAEVHIAGVCKECAWRAECLEEAEKKENVSLIYNLSKVHRDQLRENNITNLKEAANLDIQKLKEIKGLEEHSLTKWKNQAQSLLDKKAIKVEDYKFEKKKDIYFDIEDTENEGEKIVYLFGIIEDNKYIHFTAEDPKDEELAWKGFLDYFKDKDNFNLFVYSGHEKYMINKLFSKYGGDEKTFNTIIKSLVDLLPMIKNTYALPIYTYSIKDVAKFLGFKWNAEDASGSNSMLWYDTWLEKKDRSILNKILTYNEDDCKAMIVVKEFIEE